MPLTASIVFRLPSAYNGELYKTFVSALDIRIYSARQHSMNFTIQALAIVD